MLRGYSNIMVRAYSKSNRDYVSKSGKRFHSCLCVFIRLYHIIHSFIFFCPNVHVFPPSNSQRTIMAKRKNIDEPKNESAKRARNPTVFRAACPRESQSVAPSSSSSMSTTSRITTLVLGPKGRRTGKRKDRSHATQPTLDATLGDTIPDAVNAPEEGLVADATEDGVQLAEALPAVQIEAKPKRKRDNKTQVCDCVITIGSLLTLVYFEVKTARVAVAS